MKPENFIISIENEEFEIRFEEHGWISGYVYPISKAYDREGNWVYDYRHKDADDYLNVFDEKKARCLFGFTFTWRGVWEGRLYFKDDEYWSEELGVMNAIWADLEARFKEIERERVKKDYGYDPFDMEQ